MLWAGLCEGGVDECNQFAQGGHLGILACDEQAVRRIGNAVDCFAAVGGRRRREKGMPIGGCCGLRGELVGEFGQGGVVGVIFQCGGSVGDRELVAQFGGVRSEVHARRTEAVEDRDHAVVLG